MQRTYDLKNLCVNCARRGLWGLWVSNRPELPGRQAFDAFAIGYSRRQLFERVETSALRPLPAESFML
jgi:hypothetical protein